jgi:filamentous hemagglutinin
VVKRELAADHSFQSERYYVGDEFEVTEHADGTIDYVANLFLGGTQIARVLRTEQSGNVSAAEVEYLLVDRQGSPNIVAGADGSQLRTNQFTPFGEPQATVEGPGYTGHRHDTESDIIDMRGRLYDPVTARFLTADPIVSHPHMSEGLNPYSYVFNSPLNWVDPSGFEATSFDTPEGYGYAFTADTITPGYAPLDAPLSSNSVTDPGGAGAGTEEMPAGTGVWNPGSNQTGDIVPGEGTSGSNDSQGTGWSMAQRQRILTAATPPGAGPLHLTPDMPAGDPMTQASLAPWVGEAMDARMALSSSSSPNDRFWSSVSLLLSTVFWFGPNYSTTVRGAGAVIEEGKLAYLLGTASGRAHNIERALQNAGQLARVGVQDTPAGRALLQSHLQGVAADASNVARAFSNQYGNYVVKESLFAGPGGFLKLESTWQVMEGGGLRLTTAIPFGG